MKIHLVGVGGISMRGLAAYYVAVGHAVTGCDLQPVTLPGIATSVGHDPKHVLPADLVVYTSAVSEASPAAQEIAEAKKRGIAFEKRAAAIGKITQDRLTIAVSGMHGKSTTTGLIAHILIEARKDPLVMVGAPLPDASGATFRMGDGPFVLEADEYDRSFLSFTPQIAVITNIEPEHLDYYTGGLPEILNTFTAFLLRIKPGGTVVACADDVNVARVLTKIEDRRLKMRIIRYGTNPETDYHITHVTLKAGTNEFTVVSPDRSSSTFHLQIPGAHNQLNAAAAIAVCDILHIPRTVTAKALGSFRGVGQRFEMLGEHNGALFISDYAHHPTEIRATLAAARAWYPGRRRVAVFQPHQYVRTKLHFAEFVAALAESDAVIVTDIFAVAGRDERREVTAGDLAAAINARALGRARYLAVPDLPTHLPLLIRPGDVVLLMGAGRDIARLAEQFRV